MFAHETSEEHDRQITLVLVRLLGLGPGLPRQGSLESLTVRKLLLEFSENNLQFAPKKVNNP